MENNHSHFQPTFPDAEGKPNSRVLIRIEQDGTHISLIRLHVVTQREREEIIFIHFLKKYLPLVYRRDCDVNVLSRDAPWDFALEIEGGDNLKIEITSIADNQRLFELESAERELSAAKASKHLEQRKIQKLNKLFPQDNIDGSTTENNPYFGKQVITISSLPPPTEPYETLISAAISAKTNKTHSDKEKTILIIDDQTTAFTSDQILSSLNNIQFSSQFKEIWIYIGYWGTLSGDGEYTLIRLRPFT